jgi:hypothetical protein
MRSNKRESERMYVNVRRFGPAAVGVKAIAIAANLSTRQTYHALERGHLPASKVGRKWVSTPRRLRSVFVGDAEPMQSEA